MNNEELKDLGLLIAIANYCNDKIDNYYKPILRNLTKEELEKVNKSNYLNVKPKDYTKTIYSQEYKNEIEKIKALYPPTKETIENYSIELTAKDYSLDNAKTIIENIFPETKKTLKTMVASKTKRG